MISSIGCVLVLVSALWVYVDARRIGVAKGLIPGFTDMGPLGWALSTAGLWILAFPMYLSNRERYRSLAITHVAVTKPGRGLVVGISLFGVAAIAFAIAHGHVTADGGGCEAWVGEHARPPLTDEDRVHAYAVSCDAKNYLDCFNLGVTYQRAIGHAQDLHEAAVLYKESCAHEIPQACFNLGLFYVNGWAVERDPTHGRELIAKACSAGVEQACRSK